MPTVKSNPKCKHCKATLLSHIDGWICPACDAKIVPYSSLSPRPKELDLIWSGYMPDIEDETECDACDGTGRVDCDHCDGTGEYECEHCGYEVDCKHCDGEGSFRCDKCDGSGVICTTKELF